MFDGGDTLAVGAFRDTIGANSQQGSAYIFTRGGGAWTQRAKLTASDGAVEDHFGYAVALNGDWLVVGAPSHAIGSNDRPGSAYVFARSGTAWIQAQKLGSDNAVAGNLYGSSVALNDGAMAVGALGEIIGGSPSRGSAYVYTFLGSLPWCLGLAWAGQRFSENWDWLKPYFHRFDFVLGILIVLGAVWFIRSRFKALRAPAA